MTVAASPDVLGGDVADDLAATALALARRFGAGATLWCLSPTWPHHARHVAVEFVHPVIVGKRALPAVALGEHGLVAALRASARPGDVALVVAAADEPGVAEVLQRAGAWGVRTVWVGAGRRPPAGAADHLLWLDDADDAAAYDGRFVFLYHVLWELCHVCFEHPGLRTEDTACEGEVCITCSDEGRLCEVVDPRDGADVLVRSDRGLERVDATLAGPLRRYDLVLVHAGSVISTVDPAATASAGTAGR